MSQARPAISTSISSASARRNGPMPICPTMCAASVTSSSVKVRHVVDAGHRAGAHRCAQSVARQIGAQHTHAEVQSLRTRDFADDGECRVQMRRRARGASRADHQRHINRTRTEQHLAQVAPRRRWCRRHLAFAEIGGPDIDRAHVAADQVRLARQTCIEGRSGNAVAELSRCAQKSHRSPGAAHLLEDACSRRSYLHLQHWCVLLRPVDVAIARVACHDRPRQHDLDRAPGRIGNYRHIAGCHTVARADRSPG